MASDAAALIRYDGNSIPVCYFRSLAPGEQATMQVVVRPTHPRPAASTTGSRIIRS